MTNHANPPGIPLPARWSQQTRSAMLHVISFARVALTHARGWAVNSPIARVTQVLALLRLAPDIQEYIMSLPKTDRRSAVTERALRPIAQLDDHEEQRAAFSMLLDFELSSEGALEPR